MFDIICLSLEVKALVVGRQGGLVGPCPEDPHPHPSSSGAGLGEESHGEGMREDKRKSE